MIIIRPTREAVAPAATLRPNHAAATVATEDHSTATIHQNDATATIRRPG